MSLWTDVNGRNAARHITAALLRAWEGRFWPESVQDRSWLGGLEAVWGIKAGGGDES